MNGTKVQLEGNDKLTFSGVGAYQPRFFRDVLPNKPAKLAPLLRSAINDQKISGEHFHVLWIDVGTPARLDCLDDMLASKKESD